MEPIKIVIPMDIGGKRATVAFTHQGTLEQTHQQIMRQVNAQAALLLGIEALPLDAPELTPETARLVQDAADGTPLDRWPDIPAQCDKGEAEAIFAALGFSELIFAQALKGGKFTKATRTSARRNAPWLFDKAEVIAVAQVYISEREQSKG